MKKYVITWMVIAWVYAGVLVAVTLALHHSDWTWFADISPLYLNHDTSATSVGYDGQFDYFIASDPVTAPEHLDVPVYRFQRIAYPMLARLMALGRAEWIPITLVLVNVILIGLGTGAFAALLYHEQAPTWLPVVFFAWFGVGYSLLYDLNEITAVTFALGGLVYFQRRKMVVAGVLFGIAALGKDLALLLALPVLAAITLQRDWRSVIQFAALAFGPYIGWSSTLRLIFGHWQTVAVTDPQLMGICSTDPSVSLAIIITFIPAIIVVLTAIRQWRELYFMATLVGILFYIFLLMDSFCGHALFRLSTPLVLASALLMARLHRRTGLVVCGAAWMATALLAWLIVLNE